MSSMWSKAVASAGCIDREVCSSTGETMSGQDWDAQYQADIRQLREELEAALLQVHAEIAEDRKRITMIEEFSRELFSVLWVKFRGIRFELDEKVRRYVPYFYSNSTTKQSMVEAES